MPLYQYECESCQRQFDDIRKYDQRDLPAECPECGESSGKRVLGGYSVSAGGTSSSGISSNPSCTVGGG